MNRDLAEMLSALCDAGPRHRDFQQLGGYLSCTEIGLHETALVRLGLSERRGLWLGVGTRVAGLRLDLARRFSSHPAFGDELPAILAYAF